MPKLYHDDENFEEVENINFYLMDGPNIFVESRSTPICPVPKMIAGSKPTDGGFLILSEEEKNYFIEKYPQDKKFVRQMMGADEFTHNKKRYCLWLVDATPDEIKHNKFIYERVKRVKEFRLQSKKVATQKSAEIPHLFQEIRQPNKNYILVPSVTTSNRKYIPIGWVDKNIICTNLNLMIPDAELWHFGILTSRVHMAWTKAICGRLGNAFRYSAKIVYNNFVWFKMYREDYDKLNKSAQKILDCRKKYLFSEELRVKSEEFEKKSLLTPHSSLPTKCSLADLYDDVTMPKDLRRAHLENDKIVMKIYQMDYDMTDEEIAVDMLLHYDNLKNFREGKVAEENFGDNE